MKKEKPPKMTPVSISRGTFTVDGVIGKAVDQDADHADVFGGHVLDEHVFEFSGGGFGLVAGAEGSETSTQADADV